MSLRKVIFQDKALESLLFSRKQFIRSGISFQARQYTDEHLAGLIKLGFKETQLEALQKFMELITGVKLTSNLKKNLKRARNLGLEDARKAEEMKTGRLKSANYRLYVNIEDVIELQLRRVREKSNLGFTRIRSTSGSLQLVAIKREGYIINIYPLKTLWSQLH